jgi:transcriptional regulator with XRE-family HTH domain
MPRIRDQQLIETIGKRIAKARSDRGVTQEVLGEVISLEPLSVSRLERGERSPSVSVLQAISDALNIPLSALVDDSTDLPTPEHTPAQMELLRLTQGLSESQMEALLVVAREFAS